MQLILLVILLTASTLINASAGSTHISGAQNAAPEINQYQADHKSFSSLLNRLLPATEIHSIIFDYSRIPPGFIEVAPANDQGAACIVPLPANQFAFTHQDDSAYQPIPQVPQTITVATMDGTTLDPLCTIPVEDSGRSKPILIPSVRGVMVQKFPHLIATTEGVIYQTRSKPKEENEETETSFTLYSTDPRLRPIKKKMKGVVLSLTQLNNGKFIYFRDGIIKVAKCFNELEKPEKEQVNVGMCLAPFPNGKILIGSYDQGNDRFDAFQIWDLTDQLLINPDKGPYQHISRRWLYKDQFRTYRESEPATCKTMIPSTIKGRLKNVVAIDNHRFLTINHGYQFVRLIQMNESGLTLARDSFNAGEKNNIEALSLLPGNRFAASAKNSVMIWHLNQRDEMPLQKFECLAPIASLAVSAQGTILTGHNNGSVSLLLQQAFNPLEYALAKQRLNREIIAQPKHVKSLLKKAGERAKLPQFGIRKEPCLLKHAIIENYWK